MFATKIETSPDVLMRADDKQLKIFPVKFIFEEKIEMRETAGEISLCGNVRENKAKCGSLPPNAGGLATMHMCTA